MNQVLEQSVRAQAAPVTSRVLVPGEGARVTIWPRTTRAGRDSSDLARVGTRFLNVVIALAGLVLASPVMFIVAVLVKLTSAGPIIFTQTRVGIDRRNSSANGNDRRRKVDYGGRLFHIYKFRTMKASGSSTLQVWAEQGDKRVTSLGKYLRKYRLDELPQLVNVLKGDMNVVGPRPEQPDIFVDLRGQIHGYEKRQQVLPGITGWAQVNHSYDSSVEDVRRKLAFDLEYIERQTPLNDLKILVKTIPVVLLKRGGW